MLAKASGRERVALETRPPKRSLNGAARHAPGRHFWTELNDGVDVMDGRADRLERMNARRSIDRFLQHLQPISPGARILRTETIDESRRDCAVDAVFSFCLWTEAGGEGP